MAYNVPLNNVTRAPERDLDHAADTRLGRLPRPENKLRSTRYVTDIASRNPLVYDQVLIDTNTPLERGETAWLSRGMEQYTPGRGAAASGRSTSTRDDTGYEMSRVYDPNGQFGAATMQGNAAPRTRSSVQVPYADQMIRRYGGRVTEEAPIGYGQTASDSRATRRLDMPPAAISYPSVNNQQRALHMAAAQAASGQYAAGRHTTAQPDLAAAYSAQRNSALPYGDAEYAAASVRAAAAMYPTYRHDYRPPDYYELWDYQARSQQIQRAHDARNAATRADAGFVAARAPGTARTTRSAPNAPAGIVYRTSRADGEYQ